MNLVNLVKDQLGGSVINQLGGLLGEGGANTEKAISGAIPSILGGMMNSAGTAEGANRLNRALDDQDDSILDNLGGLLGGGGHTEVANRGSSVLGSLLGGNMLGSLAGALSGFSGMGRGSTGSLIGMLAPIVMSVLRRQRNSQGLDAGGLAQFLGGQKDNIAAAMPMGLNDHFAKEGIGDSLMGNLRDGASNVAGSVSGAASNTAEAVGDAGRSTYNTAAAGGAAAAGAAGAAAATGGGLLRKLIPLLILLLVAWLLWKFLFSGGADKVTDMAKNAGSAVTETASNAAGAVSDTASSATSAVTSAATSMVGGDVGGTLDSVFSDATDSIGGIKDAASAEAAIPGLEGMADKVSGLSGAFGALGGDAKGQVASMIGEKMPALEGAVNTALGIPGVGDKLGPVVTKLMSALNGLTQ